MSAERIDMSDFVQSMQNFLTQRHNLSMHATGVFNPNAFARRRLELSSDTKSAIEREFLSRKVEAWGEAAWGGERGRQEAKKFARSIERIAESMAHWISMERPEQDVRRDHVNQFALALTRLHETLAQLDSAALSYIVQQLDQALTGGESSVTKDPEAAFVVAGQLREIGDEVLPVAALVAQKAVKTLPIPDRKAFDWRLRGALKIHRLFFDNRFDFEVKETGFAADCFRWACELANPEREMARPKNWLEKAAKHPEAMTNILGLNKTDP